MRFPFFKVSRRSGSWVTAGSEAASFGHPIQMAGGSEPAGIHGSWQWSGDELTAQVDRLGFCNLFYSEEPEGISISSSPIELIAQGVPAAPDDRALGVFLRIGLFLNEDTPFRSIRVLPPGGRLIWRDGRTRMSGGRAVEPEANLSADQAVEGFIEGMRQAVGSALASFEGDTILPLSGGRDSRHILFELERHGALPRECITYHHGGASCGAEVASASQVAERTGVLQRVLDAPRSHHEDVLRTFVITHLCSDEHTQMLPLREYCRDRSVGTFDGIAGDVLSRNGGFSDEQAYQLCRADDFLGAARRQMAGHHRVIGGVSPADLFGEVEARRRFPEEETAGYIAETIAGFSEAADPFAAYLFGNRTRREISLVPTAILSQVDPVLCPYLDPDLVRFLLSVPFEVTRGGRFHDAAIAAGFPQHADLPYQEELVSEAVPRSRGQRVRTLLDGFAVVARVAPRQLVPDAIAMLGLGLSGTTRQGRDLLRFHRMCIENMDSGFARRLLEVASRLGG